MPDWLGNPFYNIIASLCETIYTPLSGEVMDWLYVNKDGSVMQGLIARGGFCESVFNSLIMIAGILLIMYMFMSLTDKVMKELASTQIAVKALMELLVASIILLEGYPLVSGVASSGDIIIDFLGDANSTSNQLMIQVAEKYHLCILQIPGKTSSDTAYIFPSADLVRTRSFGQTFSFDDNDVDKLLSSLDPSIKDYASATEVYNPKGTGDYDNWDEYLDEYETSYLGNMVSLLVPYIAAFAVNIFAIAASVGRLIQLCIYVCLSPLAIVNVFGEGMHSQGVRFFKKLFACSLQGPAMAIVLMLSSEFSVSNTINGFTYLAVQIATLMALFKASSFANDLVL